MEGPTSGQFLELAEVGFWDEADIAPFFEYVRLIPRAEVSRAIQLSQREVSFGLSAAVAKKAGERTCIPPRQMSSFWTKLQLLDLSSMPRRRPTSRLASYRFVRLAFHGKLRWLAHLAAQRLLKHRDCRLGCRLHTLSKCGPKQPNANWLHSHKLESRSLQPGVVLLCGEGGQKT